MYVANKLMSHMQLYIGMQVVFGKPHVACSHGAQMAYQRIYHHFIIIWSKGGLDVHMMNVEIKV